MEPTTTVDTHPGRAGLDLVSPLFGRTSCEVVVSPILSHTHIPLHVVHPLTTSHHSLLSPSITSSGNTAQPADWAALVHVFEPMARGRLTSEEAPTRPELS